MISYIKSGGSSSNVDHAESLAHELCPDDLLHGPLAAEDRQEEVGARQHGVHVPESHHGRRLPLQLLQRVGVGSTVSHTCSSDYKFWAIRKIFINVLLLGATGGQHSAGLQQPTT